MQPAPANVPGGNPDSQAQAPLPTEDVAMDQEPSNGTIAGTEPQPDPAQQNTQFASMDPSQRASETQQVYKINQKQAAESINGNYHSFKIDPEDQAYIGGSEVLIPVEGENSTSISEREDSKGNLSATKTTTFGEKKPNKEMQQNFDDSIKGVAILKKSQSVQDAMKAAGGFDKLMIASPKGGYNEKPALTFPGSDKRYNVSEAEMKAFEAITALPKRLVGKNGSIVSDNDKNKTGINVSNEVLDQLMTGRNVEKNKSEIINKYGPQGWDAVYQYLVKNGINQK
jgi:hypothetical protein